MTEITPRDDPHKSATINPHDAILIDDDPNIRMLWSMAADMADIKLLCFANTKDFELVMSDLNKQQPIYIDSSLNEDEPGEVRAKHYFELGFETIYLMTGYDPEHFKPMHWIKAILGKSPNFEFLETI